MPWYEYPARYRMIRERLLAANGGLVYQTYFDVARRYLFRSHDCSSTRAGAYRCCLRRALKSGRHRVAGRLRLPVPFQELLVRGRRSPARSPPAAAHPTARRTTAALRLRERGAQALPRAALARRAAATNAGIGVSGVEASTRMPAVSSGACRAISRCQYASRGPTSRRPVAHAIEHAARGDEVPRALRA